MLVHWRGLHNRQFCLTFFKNLKKKYFVEVNKTVGCAILFSSFVRTSVIVKVGVSSRGYNYDFGIRENMEQYLKMKILFLVNLCIWIIIKIHWEYDN